MDLAGSPPLAELLCSTSWFTSRKSLSRPTFHNTTPANTYQDAGVINDLEQIENQIKGEGECTCWAGGGPLFDRSTPSVSRRTCHTQCHLRNPSGHVFRDKLNTNPRSPAQLDQSIRSVCVCDSQLVIHFTSRVCRDYARSMHCRSPRSTLAPFFEPSVPAKDLCHVQARPHQVGLQCCAAELIMDCRCALSLNAERAATMCCLTNDQFEN